MTGGRVLRWTRLGAALVAALLALWLAGLAWFVHLVPTTQGDGDTPTDAIVVLTGGSLRVESGLQLLAAGKGKKLFVSGVYHGVEVGDLLRASRLAPERLQCCVVLGHEAETTHGNALETAVFMHEQDFHSLRLVTASYHMPRSLMEFQAAMPDIAIIPYPVFPGLVRDGRWWARPASLGFMTGEYMKYLGARLRLLIAPSP
ncbi:MAG TPA: YdcF family protein [Stellaceae bacterium]|nr:YdcF family protein [Stellaceae bacterium]